MSISIDNPSGTVRVISPPIDVRVTSLFPIAGSPVIETLTSPPMVFAFTQPSTDLISISPPIVSALTKFSARLTVMSPPIVFNDAPFIASSIFKSPPIVVILTSFPIESPLFLFTFLWIISPPMDLAFTSPNTSSRRISPPIVLTFPSTSEFNN